MGKNGINRICIHWTAGFGTPNNDDMQHYHIIVDNKGNYIQGYHKISDNANCKDGNYAQHCALGNTGTIGIACCGMVGFNIKTKHTESPLTEKQIESLCKKCAELAKEWNIPIDSSHIYTHMEYDSTHAKEGKIDIVYLPHNRLYSMEKVGNYLRGAIKDYYKTIQENK